MAVTGINLFEQDVSSHRECEPFIDGSQGLRRGLVHNLNQSACQGRLSGSAFKIRLGRKKYTVKALAVIIALRTLNDLGHWEA